jgi:DNA primase
MPPHDSTLEDIKDRLDIVDFISEYVNLKKAGQNWKGLCPFHAEKTPSFTVSPAKQIFHCFGCGTGGDIFTFLTRHESLSFPEALRALASRAGVTIKSSRQDTAVSGVKENLLAIHRDALFFFRQQLPKNAPAAAYLKKRGIHEDAQNLFSVGYAPKSWNAALTFLERKGYKPELIHKAGVVSRGSKGYYDTFRDRIIFPIYDLKGEVVAFGGRSIDGSEPKYLNSPETPIFNKRRVLYGLSHARDAVKSRGYAMFMEGYLDVITAHIHGFTNAVAPLGTALTQEHGKLIKRFTENVLVVFDSDASGIKAAKSASHILLESDLNVKVLSIPGNDDPDGYLRKKGGSEFEKLLRNPLTVIDFFITHGKDRRVMVREILETIAKVPDKVLQGEYIKTLSEKLNVEERYVREEFQRLKKRPQSGYREPWPNTEKKPARKPLDEAYIIQLLLQLPERVDEVCRVLTVEDFRDITTRRVFENISKGAKDLSTLLSQSDENEKNFLTGISVEHNFEDPEKVLDDCIRRLKDNRRKSLLRELQGKIKEAESKKDFVRLKKLQEEQYKLIKSQMS